VQQKVIPPFFVLSSLVFLVGDVCDEPGDMIDEWPFEKREGETDLYYEEDGDGYSGPVSYDGFVYGKVSELFPGFVEAVYGALVSIFWGRKFWFFLFAMIFLLPVFFDSFPFLFLFLVCVLWLLLLFSDQIEKAYWNAP
jgi:hypothetical protein